MSNGWPDDARPGMPLNPDVDGWHWVHWRSDLHPVVAGWNARSQVWLWPGEEEAMGAGWVGPMASYLGPVAPPDTTAQLAGAERGLHAIESEAAEAYDVWISDGFDTGDVIPMLARFRDIARATLAPEVTP